MTIPNLQLPHDRLVDPGLIPVLEKLSIDKPNWFYTALPKSDRKAPYFENNRAVMGGQEPPDGFKYVAMVVVQQGGREAGRISVDIKHSYSSGKRELQYGLTSPRIDNGRRGNSMYSTKADVAVRNAKKFFEPLKMGEILFEKMESARNDYIRALNDLGAPIREYRHLRSEMVRVQKYLYAHFNGVPVSPEKHDHIKSLFAGAFEEDLSKYELSRRMRKLKDTILYGADGGFYFWGESTPPADKTEAATAPVMFLPFDDLPESIQNKVAVLQLMQDKEVVLDMGFKHGDNVFLVAHD